MHRPIAVMRPMNTISIMTRILRLFMFVILFTLSMNCSPAVNGQQTVVEDDAIRLDSQGEIRKIVNLCTGQLGRADLHAQPFDGHRLGMNINLVPFMPKWPRTSARADTSPPSLTLP